MQRKSEESVSEFLQKYKNIPRCKSGTGNNEDMAHRMYLKATEKTSNKGNINLITKANAKRLRK